MNRLDDIRHHVVMAWLNIQMDVLDSRGRRGLLILIIALTPGVLFLLLILLAEPMMSWVAEPLADCWEVNSGEVRCFTE